ncbi:hypothetical protein [Streptomyces triticirhizae]|uniref:Uncharacterized protein n=1 Tax=Streptomyces triticirhizae TaxID=2483353 RepID=A0A3M2LWZ9_9ACTN|nr:hypothetical protein [Streptomyces triticirhizae]RMI41440.1 hypothetical protein EBN88_10990 [Streptomyces triticirhizae]
MEPITAIAIAGVGLVAKGALESAGEEAGRAGWGGGERLLTRLRARFRGDAEAEAALGRVQRAPEDEQARETLQRMLLTHLTRDPDFAAEVRELVREAGQVERLGGQVNAVSIKNAQVFNEKVEIKGSWNIL